MEAIEVMKLICGYGKPLSGRLWIFHAKSHEQYTLSYSMNEYILIKSLVNNYNVQCAQIQKIELQEALDDSYTLLDVRTLDEYNESHLGGLHIPLHEIEERYKELESLQKVGVYCKSRKRSRKA